MFVVEHKVIDHGIDVHLVRDFEKMNANEGLYEAMAL
jgi:hypothetical protein